MTLDTPDCWTIHFHGGWTIGGIESDVVDNLGTFVEEHRPTCRRINYAEGIQIGSGHAHDISWVFSAAFSTDANGALLVGPVIDGVNQLIAAQKFKTIDQTLDSLPIEGRGKHVLITLARSTFPVREKLVRWQAYVAKVRSEFDRRGLDYSRLLKGLI